MEKKKSKVSGGEKVKKKHKKCHKHHAHHHHCHKHKHKRHKSGDNKRQFAVRSPHYVKSEHDSSEENNDQSMEESEQQNSSEEEREVRFIYLGGKCVERFFTFIDTVKTKLLQLESLEIMKSKQVCVVGANNSRQLSVEVFVCWKLK